MTNPPNTRDGVASRDDGLTSRNTAPAGPTTQPMAAPPFIPAWPLMALLLFAALSVETVQAQTLGFPAEAMTIARAVKDSLFRSSDPDSPIPIDHRGSLAGLSYFELDSAYSLNGDLHRYGRPRQVELMTNTGSHILFERFGRLFFPFDGKVFWLEIHRNVEAGDLSIFFTDETNGNQTYSAGRYVPLTDLGDGTYLIDFNRSYNPYCAYNSSYVCPMPPAHNHLPFAVLAGERSYGPDVAHP